jgi:hypothetical protein
VTFHYKLIELEAERVAKEQSSQSFENFPVECTELLRYVQGEVGIKLADLVPKDWVGWLSYLRNQQSVVICRGRAFKEGGMFGKHRAGLDVPTGLDSVTECRRGFDVSPPQDLDHLLINFGDMKEPRVFLWYGENIAPYKLIYQAEVSEDPHAELGSAIVEACTWVLQRPKHQTLPEFLKQLDAQNKSG